METQITITIKQDGQVVAGLGMGEKTPDIESDAAAGYITHSDDEEMTEAEAERCAVASDLANVCEYLEDSEVIKIKLIIQKAQARKERAERE